VIAEQSRDVGGVGGVGGPSQEAPDVLIVRLTVPDGAVEFFDEFGSGNVFKVCAFARGDSSEGPARVTFRNGPVVWSLK
jgi:hypothetical protein